MSIDVSADLTMHSPAADAHRTGLWDTRRGVRSLSKAVVVILVTFTAWRYAWMSDDALITMRTALNWAHGLGPQFNASERVAGYTHPLWFALVTLSGLVTDSWIYGTLYLALGLTALSATILVARTRNLWQFLTVSAVLLFSNSIVDWSTSGLENPSLDYSSAASS